MIKLLASDLDGTLLNSRKEITKEVYDAVEEAASRGIDFVPITGRPFGSVPQEVRNLPGVRYVIASSGASIWDMKENKEIHRDMIPQDMMLEMLDILQDHGFLVMIFADGRGYVSDSDMERAMAIACDDEMRAYYRLNRDCVPDIRKLVESYPQGIEKFTVNFPYDEDGNMIGVDECISLLDPYVDKLHPVYGGPINLEVSTATAYKGAAIDFLIEKLGLQKENVIAFGDSGNDVDMKGHAGTFVAMENATDDVKAIADFVTLSNEESGVAYAIKKLVFDK